MPSGYADLDYEARLAYVLRHIPRNAIKIEKGDVFMLISSQSTETAESMAMRARACAWSDDRSIRLSVVIMIETGQLVVGMSMSENELDATCIS